MSQDESQGSWQAYRRERLNRFRHALVQLHGHADRFRGCPEGQVPRLFADVYLTTDFITGHRRSSISSRWKSGSLAPLASTWSMKSTTMYLTADPADAATVFDRPLVGGPT
jgi:hypothetical protein